MYNEGKLNAEIAMQILGGPGKIVVPASPRGDDGKRKHSILTPTKNEMKDVETSSPAPKEPKTRSESWTDIYKLIWSKYNLSCICVM